MDMLHGAALDITRCNDDGIIINVQNCKKQKKSREFHSTTLCLPWTETVSI